MHLRVMNDPLLPRSTRRIRYETSAELAARLHRHPKTIEHYARTGLLPSYQLTKGGPRLFDPLEVDAALATLRGPSSATEVPTVRHARRPRAKRAVPPSLDVRRI